MAARRARGLGWGVSPGVINNPPPKPPVVLGCLAALYCSHDGLSRQEGLCGSCESQLHSFSSLDAQLFLPGALCLPRVMPGSHSTLGPRDLSLPPDLGKLLVL